MKFRRCRKNPYNEGSEFEIIITVEINVFMRILEIFYSLSRRLEMLQTVFLPFMMCSRGAIYEQTCFSAKILVMTKCLYNEGISAL